jgi:hypothetical protein
MDNTITGMMSDLATIEKSRKAKIKVKVEREGHEGHELRDDEPPALTGAHEEARAEMDAAQRETASKAISDIGCEDGPGMAPPPEQPPGASAFDRGYLDAGHSAESAQAEGPNVSPLRHAQPGLLKPLDEIALSAIPTVSGNPGPIVDTLRMHQGRAGLPVDIVGGDL